MLPATIMRGQAAGQTIGYFGGHVALGLMSAVLGPTLPALAAHVGSDPEALGILFAVRSLGYLLASLVSGKLYDRRPGHPVIIAALLAIAAGLAMVPLMPSRLWLIGLLLLLGVAQGVLDVGNNMLITRVHGAKVAPYMNALHCSYGVGALLAPLIVGASSDVTWGYWWLALAMLPIAGWVGTRPGPRARPSRAREPGRTPTHDRPLVWLLVAWFMLCQGAEAGFGGWLFTMASKFGFADAAANRLVSGFWGAFVFGRLVSIPAAARVRPQTLLTVDLGGAILSVAVLLVVPGELAVWLATLTLGLSLASVFPTTLALAATRMELDGTVTSTLFVGASVGAMLLPWALGYTLAWGPRGPLWIILADLCVAAIVLAGLGWFRAPLTGLASSPELGRLRRRSIASLPISRRWR